MHEYELYDTSGWTPAAEPTHDTIEMGEREVARGFGNAVAAALERSNPHQAYGYTLTNGAPAGYSVAFFKRDFH